jgi:hypothetical protein
MERKKKQTVTVDEFAEKLDKFNKTHSVLTLKQLRINEEVRKCDTCWKFTKLFLRQIKLNRKNMINQSLKKEIIDWLHKEKEEASTRFHEVKNKQDLWEQLQERKRT